MRGRGGGKGERPRGAHLIGEGAQVLKDGLLLLGHVGRGRRAVDARCRAHPLRRRASLRRRAERPALAARRPRLVRRRDALGAVGCLRRLEGDVLRRLGAHPRLGAHAGLPARARACARAARLSEPRGVSERGLLLERWVGRVAVGRWRHLPCALVPATRLRPCLRRRLGPRRRRLGRRSGGRLRARGRRRDLWGELAALAVVALPTRHAARAVEARRILRL